MALTLPSLVFGPSLRSILMTSPSSVPFSFLMRSFTRLIASSILNSRSAVISSRVPAGILNSTGTSLRSKFGKNVNRIRPPFIPPTVMIINATTAKKANKRWFKAKRKTGAYNLSLITYIILSVPFSKRFFLGFRLDIALECAK